MCVYGRKLCALTRNIVRVRMKRGHLELSDDRQKSYIGMRATSYLYNNKNPK